MTHLGVGDVVGGHGFWNCLQGAPHASGHCRPQPGSLPQALGEPFETKI